LIIYDERRRIKPPVELADARIFFPEERAEVFCDPSCGPNSAPVTISRERQE
jgi:hypothetical protein